MSNDGISQFSLRATVALTKKTLEGAEKRENAARDERVKKQTDKHKRKAARRLAGAARG